MGKRYASGLDHDLVVQLAVLVHRSKGKFER
jgi:hypothetical protein